MKCVNGIVEESGNLIPKCSYFCALIHDCEITTLIEIAAKEPKVKKYCECSFWVEP